MSKKEEKEVKETKKENETKEKKKLLPIILSIVGGVVVICLLVLCICLNNNPKKYVNYYFSGYAKGNAKKVCKSINKEVWKVTDYSLDECIDDGEEAMDDMDMEDMKYTIGNKKVLSKDDVEEIHDQIEEDVDDDFPKISKIVRYRVKVTYEDDDGDEEKETLYVWVAKIKGHWGIIGINDDKEFLFDVL